MKNIKRKLGRPTKLESVAINYARSIRKEKPKSLHVTINFTAGSQAYNEVAPFLNALRGRRRGIVSTFLRGAVVNAVKEVTRKS